jgi:adenylate cyclase
MSTTNVEIERKFLVRSEGWRKQVAAPARFRQGYLSTEPERTVRIRLEDNVGKLTIKGKKVGAKAPEFEYEIPQADAIELLEKLCKPYIIDKNRYRLEQDDLVWEIDEYLGENAGLVVAEVELEHEGQEFIRPDWLGDEITRDFRYSNARLSEVPFGQWR